MQECELGTLVKVKRRFARAYGHRDERKAYAAYELICDQLGLFLEASPKETRASLGGTSIFARHDYDLCLFGDTKLYVRRSDIVVVTTSRLKHIR